MAEKGECRQVLTAAFEEAALALGGVVATYPIPDEAVWDLARAIDLIHERACGRCGVATAADDAEETEHPAIVHLLAQLRSKSIACRGAGESDRGSR